MSGRPGSMSFRTLKIFKLALDVLEKKEQQMKSAQQRSQFLQEELNWAVTKQGAAQVEIENIQSAAAFYADCDRYSIWILYNAG